VKDHARGLELIKTIAHPARIQILWILREGEQYVCHLMTAIGQRQAYISQQLANLRQASLIIPTREGQRISYRLRDKELGGVLSKLYSLIAPDCYACLVPPTPWWLCPCPKCTDIRIQVGLRAAPLGARGVVRRAEVSSCAYYACVRAYRVSGEDVAVSMNSNCTHMQRWAAQLHLVHMPLRGQGTQTGLELSEPASGYLCGASCLVPALVLQTASAAENFVEPANSELVCILESVE